jgi:hypothetical protein
MGPLSLLERRTGTRHGDGRLILRLADYGRKYTDFAAFIEQEALSTGITLKGKTRTFPTGSNPTNPEREGRRSRT